MRESRPPISTEFGRVIREVNLGLPFDQALENMVRRVRSDDLELMATAISIQHQVGGNLAEILDSIAYTIRERIRIKGEIRTLTAQQRLSGYVVGFLPIGLAGFLFIAAPGFMDPMFANPPDVLGLPAGVIILIFGGFMMFIGFMLIRKIVDIEVWPMPILPIVIAAARGRRHPADRHRARRQLAGRSGPGPPDPARARCRPRTSRSWSSSSRSSSGRCARWPAGCPARSRGHRARRSPNGPRNGWPWPATRATCGSPTGSASRPSAPSSAAILFFFLFVIVGVLGLPARHRRS